METILVSVVDGCNCFYIYSPSLCWMVESNLSGSLLIIIHCIALYYFINKSTLSTHSVYTHAHIYYYTIIIIASFNRAYYHLMFFNDVPQ